MSGRLVPHPDFPAPDVSVGYRLARREAEIIDLSFEIVGDVPALRLPPPAAQARRDGLWKHTCFELFLKAADAETYTEFNASPSSEWAAYAFIGYREGMVPHAGAQPPDVKIRVESDRIVFDLVVRSVLPESSPGRVLSAGVCAVLEAEDGSLSYWALTHPSDRPDFHNPAGFILTLPAEP